MSTRGLWREALNQQHGQSSLGAGDTFTGAVLCGLHELGATGRSSLGSLDKAYLLEVIDNALVAAAFVCGRIGANPPWRSELENWTQ